MPENSNDNNWARWQALGTWACAIGLLVFEGVGRHFADQYGIALLGGLLGFPVIVNFDRQRRNGKSDG